MIVSHYLLIVSKLFMIILNADLYFKFRILNTPPLTSNHINIKWTKLSSPTFPLDQTAGCDPPPNPMLSRFSALGRINRCFCLNFTFLIEHDEFLSNLSSSLQRNSTPANHTFAHWMTHKPVKTVPESPPFPFHRFFAHLTYDLFLTYRLLSRKYDTFLLNDARVVYSIFLSRRRHSFQFTRPALRLQKPLALPTLPFDTP